MATVRPVAPSPPSTHPATVCRPSTARRKLKLGARKLIKYPAEHRGVGGCGFGTVLLQRALAWQQTDMEADEVECVVANLIVRRYVKGYISHKNQVHPPAPPPIPLLAGLPADSPSVTVSAVRSSATCCRSLQGTQSHPFSARANHSGVAGCFVRWPEAAGAA